MKIFKYIAPPPDQQGRSTLLLPMNAEIISVGIVDNQFIVWAEIYPPDQFTEDLQRPHDLLFVNTGMEFERNPADIFLGTHRTDNGIVWHVYEQL